MKCSPIHNPQRVCVIWFVLSLACFISAQVQPTVRKFSVYVWPAQGLIAPSGSTKAIPNLIYADDDGVHGLKVTRGQLSRTYAYRGDSPLRLRVRPVASDTQDSPASAPYATVPFRPEWDQFTVLVYPEQRGTQGVRATALDFRPDRVPVGKATFYNASTNRVRFVAGGRAHSLAPGQRLALSRSELEERRTQGLSEFRVVVGRQDRRQRWSTVYNRLHYLDSSQRCLFVIAEYGNRVQVHPIVSHPPGTK